MSTRSERMRAFTAAIHGLEKTALNLGGLGDFAKKVAPTVGSMAGVGAVGGAAVGGLSGGISSYRDARRQGAGGGQAVLSGVMGAGSGATKGALVGGALGAGGGAIAGHLNPQLGTQMAEMSGGLLSNQVGKVSRFGQRQLHGLTGWTPEKGLQSIHGGAHQAAQALEGAYESGGAAIAKANEGISTAQKALQDAKKARSSVAWGTGADQLKVLDANVAQATKGVAGAERGLAGARSEIVNAEKGLGLAQQLEDKGLTHLPGIAKGLMNNPGETAGLLLKHQWGFGNGMGTNMNRLFTFGLPAAGVAGAALGPEQDQEGRGRIERGARALAGGALFPLLGGMPMATNMALSGYAQQPFEAAAGLVGRVGDTGVQLARSQMQGG